jgi:hypothetical protein
MTVIITAKKHTKVIGKCRISERFSVRYDVQAAKYAGVLA